MASSSKLAAVEVGNVTKSESNPVTQTSCNSSSFLEWGFINPTKSARIAQVEDIPGQHLLSLPSEILAVILTHLSAISPLCLSDIYRHLDIHDARVQRLGWMNITHVCARLRNIALGMPMLWASLVLAEDSTRWLSDVLHRSGDQPLTLSLHKAFGRYKFDHRKKAYAALTEPCHLSRVKSVIISDLHGWRPFARTLLTQPAPQLEDLVLGPKELHAVFGLHKVKMFVLPKTLAAPRLCKLSLTQCDFLWTSLRHFSTLTALFIDRYHYLSPLDNDTSMTSGTRLGSVVTCLCALPCLEELSLPPATAVEFPRISLPKLHSIIIKQRSLHRASLILDLLDAPKLDYCGLSYWTTPGLTDSSLSDRCVRLTRFLSNFAANLPGPIHTLNLNFGQPGHIAPHFGAEDATLSASCLTERGSSPQRDCLKITITMAAPLGSPSAFPMRHACVEPIISALPLTSPYEDESFHSVDFALWRRIYDQCASLALAPLIPLLATRNLPSWTIVEPPPEPRIPVFPSLKHLCLLVEGFDVVDLEHTGRCENMEGIVARYLEVVRDSLASRANSGHASTTTQDNIPFPKLDSLSMAVDLSGKFEETFGELFAPVAKVDNVTGLFGR
ncbi:hypothetical protein BC629DRAFT_1463150 [Irpex lacteus]|nr:hypothetical protein BC629DRAFT_1463150 [Irpex lacteus]